MIKKKYGLLTPIKKVKSLPGHNGRSRYRFKCDCGNLKDLDIFNVKNGSTVSCGCHRLNIRKEVMLNYAKRKYPFSVEQRYYKGYEGDAKRNGREFDVTFEEFLVALNLPCHYCGRKKVNKIYNKSKTRSIKVNGLDRIDSTKGYVDGNIVVCCKDCNIAKNILNYDDFINLIHMIYKNLKKNKRGNIKNGKIQSDFVH